ncbi:class I SAM-dependent DNA methyltransferase [Oceaniglobus roseus]|uniref:class I SAM-dependent DNA methyltransferase n=1 Tax=Oceaniglobus roseus TaxID=1737570 RepID=UPI000C7EEDDB|nr:class I SAM-dependent methyltransferase [Kandeliimicrobium roseum]
MSHPAAKEVIALYRAEAARWMAARGQALIERDWLRRFRALLPATAPEVLDLGCGSGRPMAAHLIGAGCRMTGVDAAASLLEAARRDFPAQRWIEADMRRLPDLGLFDGVLAWHSLFHLTPEDQRAMFPVFARLARPGAALMFTSGTEAGEAIGAFAGRPLYHASLDTAEYRALLEAEGFEVLRHVASDPDCGGATVWLARRRAPDGTGGTT